MNSKEEVFPWSSQTTDTIENLHAQLVKGGSYIPLQRLREIQLKIIESTNGIKKEDLLKLLTEKEE
jgi:hypothetical protein